MGDHRSLWIQRGLVATILLTSAGVADAFPVGASNKANHVVGQADYATGFVDFAIDPFFGGGTSNRRMFVPGDVAYDGTNQRVFVADVHNHRFLVFSVGGGITPDMGATFVLGQPDFVTGGADAASPFGHSNTTNAAYGCTTAINACGVRRATAVAYDATNRRLFAADPDNHRVLVWNLAAGIQNGMAASNVLGQTTFTSDARNAACAGGVAGTTNACGLASPWALEYDATNRRLYVADSDNHRVVVFNLTNGITNGMAASFVLGQTDFTTATRNAACGGGGTGTPNACGLSSPIGLAFDPSGRLFVGDADNRRVVVFNTTSLASGAAAANVLGQPSFTVGTANTSCGGGTSGDTNVNACGIGMFGADAEYDAIHKVLYVSDAANHRIMTFDVNTITDGEAATGALGQPNLATGYDPASADLGGGTTRTTMVVPLGLDYDSANDQLVVADSGNHRLAVYGNNVGGEPVVVNGDQQTSSVMQPSGSVAVSIVSTGGTSFGVTLPAGTTALPGQDSIILTVDNSGNKPRIRVDAKLPPGQTKSISIPKSSSRWLCVMDVTGATYSSDPANSACSGTRFQGPSSANSCMTRVVNGDPGDGGSANGNHTITVCSDLSNRTYTISGLLHTAIEGLPEYDWNVGDDEDEPEEDWGTDGDPRDPLDGDRPEFSDEGGCDAGGAGASGALVAILLAAAGLLLRGRSSSTAPARRRARGSRRAGRRTP